MTEYIYTEVLRSELRNTMSQVVKESINSSFGVCLSLDGGRMRIYAISPPSVRLGGSNRMPVASGVFESFEGNMSKPSFLPLYVGERGIEHHLNNLSKFMLPSEKIVVQFMFRKLVGTAWKEKLIDMYDSYLRGNDFPFSFSLGRSIQDKTISFLGKIGNFELNKDYIPEVEDKILDVGYEFQMAVGILSKESDTLMKRVASTIKKYDFYNSIELRRVDYKDSTLSFHDSNRFIGAFPTVPRHIISRKELFALITGKPEDVNNATETIEATEILNEINRDSMFSFLPEVDTDHRQSSELDEKDLVSQIAQALKRVGLISNARLHNESVTEGIRLIVVQFDIPKDKNISHLQQKSKDIQAALGVLSLSIEQGDEPDTVKFVLPNDKPSVISLRELIELDSFQEFRKENALSFVVGVDEINNPIYLSLSELVHLMVAGTTGSGKSVFINSLAIALLSTHSPEDLQMIMIDPKMVELQHYSKFPHVREVITDMNHAEKVLQKLTVEMDRRYEEYQRIGVKNIQLYNESSKKESHMPYLVCIIDEYADLKDTNKDVEGYIGRLGQKARASGIHMVIATQRPDTKVISGRIKAVIPSAISFNLNNNNDYRTVFGSGIGDIDLLGRGDGLMSIVGYPKRLQRFQGCMISVDESKEEQVYKDLTSTYGTESKTKAPILSLEEEEIESPINKLKKAIATSGETRIAPLRKELGIRTETLTEWMKELEDEGWLFKHESRAKGYEVIASQGELDRWRE